MTFEELQTQLDNDLNISDENIAEKSLCLARIYQKYLKLLTSEKLKNDKIEIARKELYGKLFHELIKHGHEGFDVGKQRNSIEPYIFMNETYRKGFKKDREKVFAKTPDSYLKKLYEEK